MLTLVPLFALVGCIAPGDSDDVAVSETAQAATVSSYVSSSCSTAVVLGLSKQISDEISCLDSTLLRRFTPTANLQLTSNAVLPYLGAKAKTDLEAVATTRTVQINSAFRTVVQQYLLYRWYQQGRCGIAAAATPGRSNHESGRALDVSNYSSLISAMSARGWAHDVPGDAVHFDHLASADIRGKDVLAFQRLWNRNNPGDKISEDGSYGPQTEARIKLAPATGFAKGPTCATATAFVADTLSVDGPDRVLPQSRAHYAITIQNNSDIDWPGTAVLQTTSATTQLRDASWISATQITLLGSPIPAHEAGEISFDVMTPNVTQETPIFEQLALMAGSSQPLGTVNIALTVEPDMTEPTSSDADDVNDGELTGGCNATRGGGSSSFLVIGLALLALVRSRRR